MLPAKKRLWHRWLWYRIRRAKERVRLCNATFDSLSQQVNYQLNDDGEIDGRLTAEATKAGDAIGEAEDDLNILFQDRLLESARFWRIHVPSVSDKTSWTKFPYRNRKPMLLPIAVNRLREKKRERWLAVFGIVVGISSLVQAVFAVLSYVSPPSGSLH